METSEDLVPESNQDSSKKGGNKVNTRENHPCRHPRDEKEIVSQVTLGR